MVDIPAQIPGLEGTGKQLGPFAAMAGPPKRISTPAEYDAVPFGAEYIDPSGATRTKLHRVTSAATYEDVPEGAEYIDPKGTVRTKPTYEGVGMTTQTLWDMAMTPAERRKILAGEFGDEAVKTDYAGELYAEKDGKRFKPGRGSIVKRAVAEVGAQAAPTAGAILGGIGGFAVGGVGGAPIGAGLGGASGQAFNDSMLALAGVYDRTAAQETAGLVTTGALSTLGEGAGRVIGAAAPAVREGVSAVTAAGPRLVAKYTGAMADPAATRTAAELASKGVLVPPSAWMKEAPYLRKTVEEFDPAFRQQRVLRQSAEEYYSGEAEKLARDLGIAPEKAAGLTSATAPPSSAEVGQAMISRAHGELAERDATLNRAMDEARAAVTARRTGEDIDLKSRIEMLRAAESEARASAQRVVDEGFDSINADVTQAMSTVGENRNPGALTRAIVQKARALNAAIKSRAGVMYNAADAAAGDAMPNVAPLKEAADEFISQLPEPVKAKYPAIVQMVGKVGEANAVTFGQLRRLRSMIRQDIDYADLTPSMREGAYRHFSNQIDDVLHASDAVPELKTAAKMLDSADEFYAKNMAKFRDERIQWFTKAVEAGMPPDAGAVARTVLTPDNTNRIETVRKVVGPGLWNAVQAADTRTMMDNARTLMPGQIDGAAFAKQVMDRVQNGIMARAYSRADADRMLLQARRVMALEGKLPLSAMPGDTVSTLMQRAMDAAKAAEQAAKSDPIRTLNAEMKAINRELKARILAEAKSRRQDPLRFLYEPTAGAVASADRIMKSPDLMMAAATKFGEDSPEFTMLRQVYAMRMLQRFGGREMGGLAHELRESVTPEVQQLVFPGVTLAQAQTLARNMEFLMSSKGADTGGSIAAMERVLHPFGSIPGVGKYVEKIPGAAALGRVALGTYYSMLTWATTHPAFVQWVAKGLESGDAGAREGARVAVQRVIASRGANWGAAIGAGAGAAAGSEISTSVDQQ